MHSRQNRPEEKDSDKKKVARQPPFKTYAFLNVPSPTHLRGE